MRSLWRLLGLAVLVLTLMAHPGGLSAACAKHNCKLHCGNGAWAQLWVSSSAACAQAFNSYCGGSGNYSYTSNPNGFPCYDCVAAERDCLTGCSCAIFECYPDEGYSICSCPIWCPD